MDAFTLEGPLPGQGRACEAVLRALPDWFGIEEALAQYARDADGLPTFVARAGQQIVGFLTLRPLHACAWEIHVMGILPACHGRGLGKKLFRLAEEYAAAQKAEFMVVKTVGPSSPDPFYARTRRFYESVGFRPLGEFPRIWDERNPCLIMVRVIKDFKSG